MDCFWRQFYDKGVPHEINPELFENIPEILNVSAQKYGDKPALTCLGKKISFQELETLSDHLAAYFQETLGLRKGDRLALMLPNCPIYHIALFGAFKAGLVIVNVNPLYTAKELAFQLNDSGATSILILENFAHVLEEALDEVQLNHIIVAKLGDFIGGLKGAIINFVVKYIKKRVPKWSLPEWTSYKEAMRQGKYLDRIFVEIEPETIAFLQYTGGTTGVPKAAVLTHRNVVANILQGADFVKAAYGEGESTVVVPLPLYHIFALTFSLYLIYSGSNDLLIVNPRDLPAFVEELKKNDFQGFIGLNTLFHALCNFEPFVKLKFQNRFYTIAGGMSTKPTVAKRWQEVTGSPVVEGYGLTETSPVVTLNPIFAVEHDGTIGYPLPSVEIDVRDDDERSVGIDEPGELVVRGPNVMQSYWNRPDETEIVFTRDGWLKTGDIVQLQRDGKVKILDRKKDMINVGGFKVFPNEVEEVLLAHPGVMEAAVIGVEDEHSGEMVKAYIVPKRLDLTKEELIEHCKKTLTGYKQPHIYIFRKELPKSVVGKVLRAKLRAEVAV